MAMGWYGSGFAPSRPDSTHLDTRPKKTRLLPRPACFNGYLFDPTRPDFIYLFIRIFRVFFNAGSSDPVNVELNQPLDRI
jgi:hypothetical protein